jgi:predicted metalloprotease with PDZ domain
VIPDSILIAGLLRVIEAERAFWQAPAPAEYLVSIGVGGPGNLSGQRLTNAFDADVDSTRTMDVGVVELFAHELMHEWIGSGRMHASSQLRASELSWFTEGFDEFETHRVMHAAGMLSDSAYIARVNKVLVEHALSPARDSSAAAILAGWWRDPSMEREPYLRGELLALRLNAFVERATHRAQSLDSLLKRMYLREDREDAGYTEERLVREFGAIIGEDVARAEIDRTINGGEITLQDDALGRCAEASADSRSRWDPGFDIDATLASKRTTGVRPGGPAAAAGMRESMPIAGVNIYRGDITRPIEIGVRTDSGVVRLRYSPEGERVPVQRWSAHTGCST